MASKRFLIVDELSSAARMPLPGCTIASAIFVSWSRFILSPLVLKSSAFAAAQLRPFLPKRLDSRQRLAFQPFQKRAARRRDIGEVVGDAGVVEGCDRIAAAGYRDKLARPGALGGMTRRRDRALIEGDEFEGPERAVPDQRRGVVDGGVDALDRLRSDIEDHAVRGNPVNAIGVVRGHRLE